MTTSDQTPTTFAALGLSAPILTALSEIGYETPSPIQAACIPHLMTGGDVLGEAQTGTGKTAAFALPALERIDVTRRTPQILVLTPTRELAIQVAEAFQTYARYLRDFHVVPLYGGQSMVVQLRQLTRGAQVIVGTPGRLMDHLKRGSLKLDELKVMVLDEADEMLRMGFIEDVEWILSHTPSTRQTALFSATMPSVIRSVAQRHQRNPAEIKIKSATSTVSTTRQSYWMVRGHDKLDVLTRILEAEDELDAAIIFVRTKVATDELANKLEARGHAAAALNGDMTQGLRERVINQLKQGQIDIVVATDVAARGIDVPRVSHVINYDVPYDTEAYVHRIGRTGRAGRTGHAILFITAREQRMLRAIEHATRQKIALLTLPTRSEMADRRVSKFKQEVLDILEQEELHFFMEVVGQLRDENELKAHSIAAALAFMAQRDKPLQLENAKGSDLPTTSEVRAPRENRDEAPNRRRDTADGKLRPYRIEVGRQHGVTPKEIVGAIANEGGLSGGQIGQIHLFDDFSLVELPSDLSNETLATLKRTRVCQQALQIQADDSTPMPAKRFGTKPGASKRPGAPGAPAKKPFKGGKPFIKRPKV